MYQPEVSLLPWPTEESRIVEIARVSSSRQDKREDGAKLLRYLIKNSHWSPFEHAHATFSIRTSRAIGAQLLRHRSFTFQELSQRYTETPTATIPQMRMAADTNRQSSSEVANTDLQAKAIMAITAARDAYSELVAAGVATECARMVLPMATETHIYMTGNVRSWIHFLAIRDDPHAQLEIQWVAQKIRALFNAAYPETARALSEL